MSTHKPATYTIYLKAENAKDEAEAARRLRAALKCLLRSFGLRCTRIEPTSEAGDDGASNGTGPTL